MANWIPLSIGKHAAANYLPRQGFAFAANRQVVFIFLAELANLIPHYVLAFMRQNERLQPVTVTGLGNGNLYLKTDGRWSAPYVPALLRSHPFRLLKTDTQDQVLCIQADHLVDGSKGQPLFDSKGNLTQPVKEMLNFLNACEKNRQVTEAACSGLEKTGVIEKWPLQVKPEEGQDPIQVDGLYRVNENALNTLNPETFAGLRSRGALALVYAHLFAMSRLPGLVERANHHAQQQAPGPKAADLEKLFRDDDILRFNNV